MRDGYPPDSPVTPGIIPGLNAREYMGKGHICQPIRHLDSWDLSLNTSPNRA